MCLLKNQWKKCLSSKKKKKYEHLALPLYFNSGYWHILSYFGNLFGTLWPGYFWKDCFDVSKKLNVFLYPEIPKITACSWRKNRREVWEHISLSFFFFLWKVIVSSGKQANYLKDTFCSIVPVVLCIFPRDFCSTFHSQAS